jgi:hypothetical protein
MLRARNEVASLDGLRASTVGSGALSGARLIDELIETGAGLSGDRVIGLSEERRAGEDKGSGARGALGSSLRMIIVGAAADETELALALTGALCSLPLTPTLSRALRGEGVRVRDGVLALVGDTKGSAVGTITSPRFAWERSCVCTGEGPAARAATEGNSFLCTKFFGAAVVAIGACTGVPDTIGIGSLPIDCEPRACDQTNEPPVFEENAERRCNFSTSPFGVAPRVRSS